MAELTKAELRAILKKKRAELPTDQKKALDSAIAEHIAASPLFGNASMLLLYAPMEGEINLLPLARLARESGIPIAFPRSHTKDCTLTFHILTPDARLSRGAYGIAEPPADAPLCVPDERALCILPGLSFDRDGNRLGYGKGYYDRFLESFPGVTLGAVYASLVLRTVPTDAHDRRVAYLVTEQELLEIAPPVEETVTPLTEYDWQNADTPSEPEPPRPAKEKPTREPLVQTLKRIRHTMWASEHVAGIRTPHAAMIPVLVTYALLLLSRLVEARLLDRGSQYVGVILLQVLIFILPAILYCKARGEKFTARIRLAPVRPSHIPLILSVLVMMIAGGLLTSILTGGIHSLTGNFTLYDTFVARTSSPLDILYAILAYALLPAFGEELIYRSILCAEYERNGVGVSITVSALFFAMLHFSFAHFLTYFVLGLLLAAVMYATRSFFVPVALHLCYNIFCLFGQPFLSAFYVNAGSTRIFLFCVIVLFLLASAIAAGEGRKIYHIYALRNADASYTVSRPIKEYPRAILASLLSPLCAVALIIFLVAAITNLF